MNAGEPMKSKPKFLVCLVIVALPPSVMLHYKLLQRNLKDWLKPATRKESVEIKGHCHEQAMTEGIGSR